MFFDVVALFVTFTRLIAMHLALRFIDTYKVRTCLDAYKHTHTHT